MSTNITSIKGRYEANHHNTDKLPIYEVSELNINRFYGGKENGGMLQLTIYNGQNEPYVQLTREQVCNLIEALQLAFNTDIYPSE